MSKVQGQQVNIEFLEYIGKTSQTIYQVIERLENAIVTARIRIAQNDREEDKQQLRLLQAVLALLQKEDEYEGKQQTEIKK